jgi:replicative DNA helicase
MSNTNQTADEMRNTLSRRMWNVVKEREILSSLIQQGPDLQAQILEHLKVYHMTHPVRGNMVEWAHEMHVDQKSINRVSMYDYMVSKGSFNQLDLDEEYNLIAFTTMENTVENTMDILNDCYKTRCVYYDVARKVDAAILSNTSIDDILSGISDVVISLDEATTKKHETLSEVATTALDEILNPTKEMLGLMIGLNAVDEQLGGFNRDTLITLAGFSGSGKTATVCDWIHRLCKHYPTEIAICFLSLEMSQKRIIRRLYSRHAKITEYKMRAHARGGEHQMNKYEQDALIEAYADVRSYPLEIVYESGIDAKAIKMIARKFALKHKGKHLFFILDHLGEVKKNSADSRVETDLNMQAMKDLCMEYDATAIVLSQLKKEVEDQKNRPYCRPNRSHVMESVGVIAKSDVMILLWRPEVYEKIMPFRNMEEWTTENKQIWLIEKNRDGHAPNDVILECDIKYNKLDNYIEEIF